MKKLKVMFGTKGANYEYKINEINISNNWNPKATNPKDFGGFNYATEDCIIRWLHRGDTLYEVEIPKDAESIKVQSSTTIYRSNKIIVKNPVKVTDEIALELYKKSHIPEKSYYKALAAVSVMNYKNTSMQILRDKVTKENIETVLEEFNDFINHKKENQQPNKTVRMIQRMLNEIKSNLLISINIDKSPYTKELSKDKIINLYGQSGSGKTYYAKENFNTKDYEIVDTDEIFKEKRFEKTTGLNKKLGKYFRKKYTTLPDPIKDFDQIYTDIINYCKNKEKTIVIDSAQFHLIKNPKLLKGQIIIIRTSIDKCYERAINRWKQKNINYKEEELTKYKNKKHQIYDWYIGTNEFIKIIDKI